MPVILSLSLKQWSNPKKSRKNDLNNYTIIRL